MIANENYQTPNQHRFLADIGNHTALNVEPKPSVQSILNIHERHTL